MTVARATLQQIRYTEMIVENVWMGLFTSSLIVPVAFLFTGSTDRTTGTSSTSRGTECTGTFLTKLCYMYRSGTIF